MLENTIREYLSSFGIPFSFDDNVVKWEIVRDKTPPIEKEVNDKITELRVAQPLKELREERNRRIAETDWRFRSDLSPSQEWIDYSQALRDFPENYSPTFDIMTEDDYPLVKEDNTAPWPEEPTDG